MVTIKNTFSGATFDYANEGVCTASGEYRVEDGHIVNISITGSLVDEDPALQFWANRDAQGIVNISGVPATAIAEAAAEVAAIITAVEDIVVSAE